ncbi:putative ribonuclease H-like domain-containing protein [Tanacetum coccineum]|uniref:Ribonuclease H-like domain-containing protein n=1 Tax=Tanacetum coccineum TaxID=301880 RepID=A0ABQ4Y189_9ASTR
MSEDEMRPLCNSQCLRTGNSPKRWGKDAKGKYNCSSHVSLDEHVVDIWMAVKARTNDDINLKFLRALPSSWSQVALALKTRGGLESMSFDDLYNKLRSLELDVRIGHSYGVKVAAAPTHSAFIGAASSGSKLNYSNQQSIVPPVSQTSGRSDSIMECVLHSFVAENEPDQDMIYEDFDQVDQLEMEELDLKWQMAMLSLRINRFEKKAGRKMNYNNQQPARFDRRKVRCYKCLQLDIAREWNVKTVDDNARYSAFKVTELKTDEPNSFGLCCSMVNWSDHAAENKTGEVEKVYGMMAGLHADNGGADVSDATAEFAMMGISPKAQNEKKEWEVKFEATLARFEKWKNLLRTINLFTMVLSWLGYVEFLPPSLERYMPTPYKTKDIPPAVDIQTLPESDVEDPNSTTGSPSFSCSENVKSPRIICNKSGVNNRKVCKNNFVRVKKCFVCGSKLHLIKDCDFYNCVDSVPCKSKAASVSAGSRISPASVPAGRSDSAASRNRPAVHSAGAPNHAGWSKRPATVSAGRPGSAGWLNPAARPYFRPSSVYFNTPTNLYDPMFMDKGRWDTAGDPSTDNDIGIVDSGCSRSMTGNKEKLADFVPIKGGIVKFGGGDGRISGKGTIRTSKLDFENVYYVEELQHFNLFSVSQICDKKNKVLFTDTDCLVLSEEFQLPDASQVVLRIPRKHDLYTFHISDLQPEQKVTCLVAKASLDESTRWHRRMAHVNFKTINKLAKEGLVDGLPLKVFTNEHNCVACNKGKQHKASYKHISAVRFITDTLQLLHMDLFGPTNIRSIDQKYYSLVVTDDFSRFSWTFFLGTKDETFYVLKEFITLIENQLNKKVKGIRCDNGTEFKNAKLIELCGEKGIKRDYSNPRTPQQNGVAERKNRTLIEAARTMLADSKLPTMFWTEAVSTACYVLNRVSITNPHNKTPYELISGKVPQIGHLKPFGCQVTILNTSDYLGKFEGKADDGYLVGYASNSKAYRVYNLPNKRVEETLNLRFLEDKPNVQGIGHEWYFDLDYLTDSLGYTRFKTDTPAGTYGTNINAGTQDHDSDSEVDEQVIVVPSFPSNRFAGPSSSNGPRIMERNADYAEELAKLQRQEYEAKDAAARYGYLFSQATAEILCQAEADIRTQGVSAVQDPAGIDSAVKDSAGVDSAVRVPSGIVSADSDPAGGNPADSFPPAGSVESADESNPAVSSSVSADLNSVYADESTLPPGQQLGTSENTTRFPVPSDKPTSIVKALEIMIGLMLCAEEMQQLSSNPAKASSLYLIPADRLDSAVCTMVLLVVILPAGRMVSAGWSMVLLVVILPAGRMVSAGWSMVLLVVIVPAGFFVPAGSYGLLSNPAGGTMYLLPDACVLVTYQATRHISILLIDLVLLISLRLVTAG